MVFGIGEGKIDILLDKMNFTEGEYIKGKVKLELNEPKHAKELKIELTGEQTFETKRLETNTRRMRTYGSTYRTVRETRTVYSFPLVLGQEKDFGSGDYPFEIAIPKLSQPKQQEGPQFGNDLLGTLGKIAIAAVTGEKREYPVKWFLRVSLNVPMSFDLNKKLQINVV